jgi:uncharacterized protein YukE
MERIRVDTDKLKEKSKEFETSAGVFSKAGNEILTVAAGLPSYDGQLSTPARAAALEINRQSQDLHRSFMNISQSLTKTAQAFEEVDNQTVEILRGNSELISNAPIYGGPGGENYVPKKQGGNHDLGYDDYGDYIIVWKNGESQTIIITNENRSWVEKYEKDVDDYCKYLAEFLETLRDLMLRGLGIGQIVLILVILVTLALISPEIMAYLIVSLGIDPELLGRIMENAQELVVHFIGEDVDNLEEKLASLLDPLDPNKYLNDIKNLLQYGQGASQALSDAENDWNALVPTPTPSGPTLVPVPTPSTPTPTQTPTPPKP